MKLQKKKVLVVAVALIMNDEIKEILEILKKCYDLKDENFDNYISLYQLGLLLDYITNLQQEIEKLNDDKRGMLVQLYKANDNRDKVKQENERLKEYIRIANVSEWFKGNDSLQKLLQNGRKDDEKTISKADFNKVWSESTTEDILNQFYYEHNDLREMLKENGNKEEVIKRQQEVINEIIEYVKKNITYYYDEDLDESVYQDEVSGDKILEIIERSAKNESK